MWAFTTYGSFVTLVMIVLHNFVLLHFSNNKAFQVYIKVTLLNNPLLVLQTYTTKRAGTSIENILMPIPFKRHLDGTEQTRTNTGFTCHLPVVCGKYNFNGDYYKT
jgi:hypothetical protein